jgi:hypothetical protein
MNETTESARMSVRAASRRSIGCAIVGATLAILAGVRAGGASAHFQTYPYTLTACPASYEHQVDPVTDVFYGAATGARVLNHIRFHTGWTDAGGSTQYFSSEGVCGAMYGQLASGSVLQSRFHIRIRRTYDDDPVWGMTARGDAHHEDFVWYCGHAVDKGGVSTGLASGFDQGRRALYDAFSGAHTYGGATYWGNTREFKQCDGDHAGSNGYVDWWRIPAWSH